MGEVPQNGLVHWCIVGVSFKFHHQVSGPMMHCGRSQIQTGSHLGRLEGQLVIRHHAVNTCAPLSIQMNMSD